MADVKGDAALAIWAHGDTLAARRSACRAALAVRKINLADDLGQRQAHLARIGLDAGPVLIGAVDAAPQVEFRAMGDSVDTASRVQELNKQPSTQIRVTGALREGLDKFEVRPRGTIRLRGKERVVDVFELLGMRPAAVI